MKKVVIALDYNTSGLSTVKTGYSSTNNLKAEAILFHVLADKIFYTSNETMPVKEFNGFSKAAFFSIMDSDTLKNALEYFLNNIKLHLCDETIQMLIGVAEFAKAILHTVKQINFDIIVMASDTRKWLDKIVLGSNTVKVLNIVSIPLIKLPVKELQISGNK